MLFEEQTQLKLTALNCIVGLSCYIMSPVGLPLKQNLQSIAKTHRLALIYPPTLSKTRHAIDVVYDSSAARLQGLIGYRIDKHPRTTVDPASANFSANIEFDYNSQTLQYRLLSPREAVSGRSFACPREAG